jgi:hypothetical protein
MDFLIGFTLSSDSQNDNGRPVTVRPLRFLLMGWRAVAARTAGLSNALPPFAAARRVAGTLA